MHGQSDKHRLTSKPAYLTFKFYLIVSTSIFVISYTEIDTKLALYFSTID